MKNNNFWNRFFSVYVKFGAGYIIVLGFLIILFIVLLLGAFVWSIIF